VEDGMHCWYLTSGNYRIYRLPLSILAASIEIFRQQLDNSTMDMLYIAHAISHGPRHEVLSIIAKEVALRSVKVEKLEPIIELSSESKGEPPHLTFPKQECCVQTTSNKIGLVKSTFKTPSQSESPSSFSCLLLHPYLVNKVSIIECLSKLGSMH